MGDRKMTKVVLMPLIETFSDPVEFARVFRNHAATEQVCARAASAKLIEDYFANVSDYMQEGQEAHDAYLALADIASQNDANARLALYMPLNFVYGGWDDVNKAYQQAWLKLLDYLDVRECFNLGDVYEREASEGDYEYVIKCLHLLPWLIEEEIVSPEQLFMLLDAHENQPIFASCVYDCLEVFEDWGCLSEKDLLELKSRYMRFDYQRPKQILKHCTTARKDWREEYLRSVDETPVTLRNITSPFKPNLVAMSDVFEAVSQQLEPGQVALVGGSRVKGYSSDNSDYDIWYFQLEELDHVDPALAHYIFDTFWVSKDPDIEAKRAAIAEKYMALPKDSEQYRDCLIRIESDLLQFRLMHKGFPYAYGSDLSKTLQKYKDIDGGSAFYDVRYRRVASILYSKYVYIP